MDLLKKKCIPCESGTLPFDPEKIKEYAAQLDPVWQVSENKKIVRKFQFSDFMAAMAFVNQVAAVSESEGHHPDIKISYNKVTVELWTHAAGGLTENDFILAAKIDQLY